MSDPLEQTPGAGNPQASPASDQTNQSYTPDEFTDTASETPAGGTDVNVNVILDVDVDLALEVGRATLSVRNLLQLNQGSVIELDRAAGEPLDVLVNGTLVARGEVVVVNDSFGIRLTEIVSPMERVNKLR